MIGTTELAAAAVTGGAAGTLAHRGSSFYHDALRPLARELNTDAASRAELARYGWGVSHRFIAWFALPFSVLTGATVSHLLFLPADILGVRFRSAALAAVLPAVVAAGVIAGASWAADLLGRLPISLGAALPALVAPVLWLYPLIPAIAAMKLPGPRRGAAVVLGASAVAAAVAGLIGAPGRSAAAAGTAGMLALLGVHVLPGLRRTRPSAPELSGDLRRIRSAAPLLAVIGAGSAVLAERHCLAGEPLASLLIGRGHAVDAAIVAFITTVAFFPLVAVSSVAADSYASQGTPDWILGLGYLLPSAGLAAGVGALAMLLEVGFVPRSCRLILRTPALSETAAGVRDAMGDLMHLALLVGGLLFAERLGGAVGFSAVGAAWILNEGLGRPVMRLAVGPAAAIIVGLVANLWLQIR